MGVEEHLMDAVPVWAVLVVLGVIGSLATWLWRGNNDRLNKHSEHLGDHETRITRLEEKTIQNQSEISTLRERWHEMTNHVSHTLAEWFNEVVKMIRNSK